MAARSHGDLDGAASAGADQLILDIEDGVDEHDKPEARELVRRWLARGGSAWVRINSRSTCHWEADVDSLRDLKGVRGVILAKTESATHVADTVHRLGGALPVIPLVETALGIEEGVSIARTRGVVRLAFGSGDYRRDTGTSADDLSMAYPRSRLVVASRVGGLPGPIDGPSVAATASAIRDQSATAMRLGMTGRLCLCRPDPDRQRSRWPYSIGSHLGRQLSQGVRVEQ